MGYFSCREVVKGLFCLWQLRQQVVVDEDKRLEMHTKMLFGRKNEVFGKLYLAFEVVAAAFGIELEFRGLCKICFGCYMVVLMVEAMQARLCCRVETTRQLVRLGAIVELDVPPNRDEQHHKGHQKRTDLQQTFFHGAKIGNSSFYFGFLL